MDGLKDKGIKDEQIIYVNFEYIDHIDITNAKALNNYIENKLITKNKYYLFFDEIQNVTEWEKVINSFKAKYKDNVSIFITGSNSDLLSVELATHIAGRYVSFKVYPFTFKEVCELKNINENDKYELEREFNDFIILGGMPQRFSLDDEMQVKTYLSDIYNSIVIKDILERFKIKDLDLFNKILTYIVTTPSQTFSAESLSNYLLKDNIEVSKTTIYNYLEYMCRSLLINKADRYDEKEYFQVAYHLNDDIIDREFGVYYNIQDNYPKYVISYDTFDFSQNGIIHKNIIDWLLEK